MNDPRHGLLARLRSHLSLKLWLAIALVAAFAGVFLTVGHNPVRPVRLLEPTAVDVRLGFDPRWVWVYLSLFFFLPLTPLLLRTRRELGRYALGVLGITAVGGLVFVLFPTAVARPPVRDPLLLYRWLTRIDPGTNAAPSLHWAFVLFTLLTAERVLGDLRRPLGWRVGYWAWGTLICVSTLGLKQHLVIDAVTGSALGLLGFALAWRTFSVQEPARIATGAVDESTPSSLPVRIAMEKTGKLVLSIVTLVALGLSSSAQTEADRAADHEALRALRTRVVTALSENDMDALYSCFTPSFVFTGSDQEVATNHAELVAYKDEWFEGDDPPLLSMDISADSDVETVFTGPDSGFNHGTAVITYHLSAGPVVEIPSRWTASMLKLDGEWKVTTAHIGVSVLDNPVMDKAVGFWRMLAIGGGVAALIIGLLFGRMLGRRGQAA